MYDQKNTVSVHKEIADMRSPARERHQEIADKRSPARERWQEIAPARERRQEIAVKTSQLNGRNGTGSSDEIGILNSTVSLKWN